MSHDTGRRRFGIVQRSVDTDELYTPSTGSDLSNSDKSFISISQMYLDNDLSSNPSVDSENTEEIWRRDRMIVSTGSVNVGIPSFHPSMSSNTASEDDLRRPDDTRIIEGNLVVTISVHKFGSLTMVQINNLALVEIKLFQSMSRVDRTERGVYVSFSDSSTLSIEGCTLSMFSRIIDALPTATSTVDRSSTLSVNAEKHVTIQDDFRRADFHRQSPLYLQTATLPLPPPSSIKPAMKPPRLQVQTPTFEKPRDYDEIISRSAPVTKVFQDTPINVSFETSLHERNNNHSFSVASKPSRKGFWSKWTKNKK